MKRNENQSDLFIGVGTYESFVNKPEKFIKHVLVYLTQLRKPTWKLRADQEPIIFKRSVSVGLMAARFRRTRSSLFGSSFL